MAFYCKTSAKYIRETDTPEAVWWHTKYSPGKVVPTSGIYRCIYCGNEVACNKGDPFPPQNKSQHNSCSDIKWELIIKTKPFS
ncbi:TPA: hypothetical protein ACK3JJ_001878 [Mannheimia haemolytica]|nr:hypothetical protein BHC25_08520 [Mannheimia haemolytica]